MNQAFVCRMEEAVLEWGLCILILSFPFVGFLRFMDLWSEVARSFWDVM